MCFLVTTCVFFCELFAIPYYFLRYIWELFTLPNLQGRCVFITGCDSGFGRAIALKCAKEGLHVFAACLDHEKSATLLDEAKGLQGTVETVELDVTRDESVDQAADFIRNRLGNRNLWAILNNAGVFTFGLDEWCTLEDYKTALDINTHGVIRVTHAFVPLLKKSKGRIITTTSVAGRLALPSAGPYSVSKFATEAYMDTVRQELAVFGIRCIIIEPGVFKTTMADEGALMQRIDRMWDRLDDEVKSEYGEEFLTYYRERILTGSRFHASKNLDWVVDAYYHAITALFPRSRYRCGWDALFYYIPVSFLPTAFGDAISSFWRITMPAVTAVKNKKYF